ncbi:MAG: isoleucine--tRNA ligase [Pseudomonadota bacterium]
MTDAAKKEKANDYSQTLFLPETEFPMRAGLPAREPEILKRWEDTGLYGQLRAQGIGRTRRVLHDGPPYANGHIHIGTALNKILKDIVVRSTQMAGFDCAYVPGWDCHGLPIEWKIEEEYRAKGKNKDEVPLVEFRRQCRAFAEKWLSVQREEFKRLGGTGNWAEPYATMDYKAEAVIAGELLKFAKSGQLYRGSKPVMWAVAERTALAEAEVEYQDVTSDQVWVKFPIPLRDTAARAGQAAHQLTPIEALEGASVVIWTTTPWTIPGNRAISFSNKISYGLYQVTEAPDDNWIKAGEKLVLADKLAEAVFKQARVEKFTKLHDVDGSLLAKLSVQHPLFELGYNFSVPLLDGDHVTDDAGTGFVHTAPSHGRDDFEVWMTNARALEDRGIDTRIPYIVDEHSLYTKEAPGFEGKRVLKDDGSKGDANDAVIQALGPEEKGGTGMLVARGRLKHSYPHSWRSKTPVIFRNTPQWFIAMDKPIADAPGKPDASGFIAMDKKLDDGTTLRSRALKAIADTTWFPAIAENRITGMVKDRPDWVMSRQRAWGVPITVFAKKDSGEILQDDAVNRRILDAFEAEGADAWFADGAAKRFWPEFDETVWTMVTDVLDVWFDSGCTHTFTLEGRDELRVNRDKGDRVIYFEGSDQHRGWFQSSLLEGCGTRGRAPYDSVITHGFVVDHNGEKMSKSKGNTVAPQDIIAQSGADILRLWVASSDYSEDLRIGNEIIKTTTETYRKLRNTLRWMLGTLAHYKESERVEYANMPELEKFMLHELAGLHEKIIAAYQAYDFKRVVSLLNQFMITDLSAFYFDIRKDALYCDAISSDRRKAALTVVEILFSFSARYLAPILSFTAEEAWLARSPDHASVHLQPFPEAMAEWKNNVLHGKWETVRQIRKVITGALEIERVNKVIGSSLEAAPDIYLHDKATAALVKDIDFAEVGITSGAKLIQGEAPAPAFTLGDVHGVAVVFKKAEGTKCARSWRVTNDIGADAQYPEVSARDAAALHEWHAAQGARA